MFGGMEAGGKYGFTNFIKDTLEVQIKDLKNKQKSV